MILNVRGRVVEFEDMEILGGSFRNFSGAPDRNNKRGGSRYFNVRVNAEEADTLSKLGVVVKSFTSTNRDTGEEEEILFFKVNINFGSQWPPHVYQVREGTMNAEPLNDETVSLLDNVQIPYADLVINISKDEYDPGKRSVYLNELYATVAYSGFRAKYNV